MKEYYILNYISIALGLCGLVSAITGTHRAIVAQRELAKLLKSRKILSGLLENGEVMPSHAINVDKTQLKKIIEEVKQVVEELPKKKRGEILDSLEQKSSKGRLNYLNKLLHMSGYDVRISAIA